MSRGQTNWAARSASLRDAPKPARVLMTVIVPVMAAAGSWCGLALGQSAVPAPAPHGEPRSGGIWKAAVPPLPMHGEFDSFDPIGVAAGAMIKADCSLNWVNPDDGARYCFSSGTSLEFFLERPHANIERARAGWRTLQAPRT